MISNCSTNLILLLFGVDFEIVVVGFHVNCFSAGSDA
jgi:hypothetical protein